MRIYKDIFTGDEMFSDSYKIKLVDNVLYEVYGNYVQRTENEIKLAGSNPSADAVEEKTDADVQSGVDVILNHRLAEIFAFQDKKSFTLYLKDYVKKVVAELEKNSPEEVEIFKTNLNKVMKDVLSRFKDLQFYTGTSMDLDGSVAILEFREIDGKDVPVLMFIKHGLTEEKF